MTGGTVKAPRYALAFLGGTNTVNMSGGSLIVTEHTAITRTAAGTEVNVTISDDAKVYAASKAFIAQSGITINVEGGLIDVANTYKLNAESDVYGVEMREGRFTMSGGKFILGGAWESAQFIAHASSNTEGSSIINGGLFVNLNQANSTLFGSNVKFNEGRVIYSDNVIAIVNGSQSAPKSLQVYYGEGDDLYYFFTKFDGADEFDLEDDLGIDKLAMLDGASIRLTKDSTGIRFTSEFGYVEGATYGTIIFPARYLANLTSLSLESLDAKGIKYENIVANEGMEVVDGVVTIKAALTNLLPENYNTPMAAIAYIELDGKYYYTDFNVEDNVRAIETVAKKALQDTKEVADDLYVYAVNTAEGTTVYSRYSASQRKILEGFVAAAYGLNAPENSTLMNIGNDSYSFYSSGVEASAYNAYKAGIEAKGFI